MAAGLVIPVSGPYAATWDGFYLGTQNDDGFVLTGTWQGQEINASDAYGMTLVEGIYRGLNWRLRLRGLEWNRPGILSALQAFGSVGAPNTTFTPVMGPVGQRWTTFSAVLSLVAVLGPIPTFVQTLTALSAIIAPQSNTEAMMTSKAREAPIEMVLFPYPTSALINVTGVVGGPARPITTAQTAAQNAAALRVSNTSFTTT